MQWDRVRQAGAKTKGDARETVTTLTGQKLGWHEHLNLRYIRREFPAGTIFIEAFRTRHRGMDASTSPTKVLFIDQAGQSNMIWSGPAGSGHNGNEGSINC